MSLVTRAVPGDVPALGRVMFAAIRHGAPAYTVAQRRSWQPILPHGGRWRERLRGRDVRVARDGAGPVGFVALRGDGYVDLAFIAPRAQGRGLFRAMMEALSRDHPGLSMFTHASLHAQPAFAALGFDVVRHEVSLRNGQRLRRALMRRG